LSKLNALPSICIVSRKAIFYLWTFREYFADRSIDKNENNPDFCNHHTVKAFIFSLDI
jgi:phage terminase large subunit